MTACPSIADWEALAQGRATAEQQASLQRHSAGCATCHEMFEAVRRNESLVASLRDALIGRLEAPAALPLGRRFGRYAVDRLLGAGGMGAVYEARQDHPRRMVALKVMYRGLAPGALKRFEREGEVLGRLHHPGIAQIFDAGTEDDGSGPRPYLAMELIRGRTLAAHVREARHGLREKLELLARVCDAVEHAHQHGIIHRDLKPSNILIDEHGQPKVLDFGVARAADAALDGPTLRTDAGQLVGTIAYMSPEQAGGRDSVDARSDVYALGVILYELLAGRPPYDLAGLSLAEAVRAVHEREPTALSSIDRSLRGDLETIVAAAVEKDPARRYQTAAALAADLRHFLADEPIGARPASAAYQFAKFARRNRLLVGGVCATFAALLLGLAGTTSGYLAARREAAVARAAGREADRRRAAAEAVTHMLEGMLKSANPHEVKGAGYTVRRLLDDFARDLGDRLAGQPESEGAVRATIGNAYRLLGEYALAAPHLDAALAARRAAYGPDHPLVALSLCDSAWLLHDRADYEGAEAFFSQSVEIERRSPDRKAELGAALMGLSDVLRHRGEFARALPLARESLEARTTALGDSHPDVAESLVNLSKLLRDTEQTDEAGVLLDRAIALWEQTYGTEHPRLVDALNDRAWLSFLKGDFAGAERTARRAAQMGERALGPSHPDVANALYELAKILQSRADAAGAEPPMRRALAIYRAAFGHEHPSVCTALESLASILRTLRRYGEAEPLAREAVSVGRRALKNPSNELAVALNTLGSILRPTGDAAGAEGAWREAISIYNELNHGDSRNAAVAYFNLAQLFTDRADLAKAEENLLESVRMNRALLGPDHAETLFVESYLARLYLRRDEARRAEPLAAHAASVARSQPVGWRLGSYLVVHAQCLRALTRFEEAEGALNEARQVLLSTVGPEHAQTIDAQKELALLYEAWGKPEDAARARDQLPAPGAKARN